MLSNFSKHITATRTFYGIGLPLWVFVGFMFAQVLVVAVLMGVNSFTKGLDSIDSTVLNACISVVIYGLTVAIIFGVPWLIGKRRTTLKDLGLQRLPTWLDLAWAPAGAVVYMIATTLVMAAATVLLPFVDYNQAQDTGFSEALGHFEYILAFFSLVVLAPFAEEVLFRGYLFGKLQKHMSLWISILITSLLFALVHFQWNVSIDVFVLSIVLCLLRVVSGSLWPSILLHMIKNGIAFYFLFINPGGL